MGGGEVDALPLVHVLLTLVMEGLALLMEVPALLTLTVADGK